MSVHFSVVFDHTGCRILLSQLQGGTAYSATISEHGLQLSLDAAAALGPSLLRFSGLTCHLSQDRILKNSSQ